MKTKNRISTNPQPVGMVASGTFNAIGVLLQKRAERKNCLNLLNEEIKRTSKLNRQIAKIKNSKKQVIDSIIPIH